MFWYYKKFNKNRLLFHVLQRIIFGSMRDLIARNRGLKSEADRCEFRHPGGLESMLKNQAFFLLTSEKTTTFSQARRKVNVCMHLITDCVFLRAIPAVMLNENMFIFFVLKMLLPRQKDVFLAVLINKNERS